jgi:N-acetylneuraminate lyase
MTNRLTGLVAATHTPMSEDGELNIEAIGIQSQYLKRTGIEAVFIGGTTGECHSLSLAERIQLTSAWMTAVKSTRQRVIVHVGANALPDAKALAAHSQKARADAIALLAPSYFKPRSVEDLVTWCVQVAKSAPELPFYFYDIPSLTGVSLPMVEFAEQLLDVVPNFAGIKFTNPDLMTFQRLQRVAEGRLEVFWGTDEYLLAALALGAKGAVGSSYNMAAPIYSRLMSSFVRGDLVSAQAEQWRSVQLITSLASSGYMASAKVMMEFLNVPVGPPRLPHRPLSAEQRHQLRTKLEQLGVFEWLQ